MSRHTTNENSEQWRTLLFTVYCSLFTVVFGGVK